MLQGRAFADQFRFEAELVLEAPVLGRERDLLAQAVPDGPELPGHRERELEVVGVERPLRGGAVEVQEAEHLVLEQDRAQIRLATFRSVMLSRLISVLIGGDVLRQHRLLAGEHFVADVVRHLVVGLRARCRGAVRDRRELAPLLLGEDRRRPRPAWPGTARRRRARRVPDGRGAGHVERQPVENRQRLRRRDPRFGRAWCRRRPAMRRRAGSGSARAACGFRGPRPFAVCTARPSARPGAAPVHPRTRAAFGRRGPRRAAAAGGPGEASRR